MHARLAPPSSYTLQQRIRYYVYTYAIIIGVPTMLVTWFFVKEADSFARFAYPLLGIYCIWALVNLVKAQKPLEHSERLTLLVLGIVWVARAVHAAFFTSTEDLAASQAIYFSYVLFCMLTYLMFDNKAAARLSTAAFVTSSLFSVAQLLFSPTQSSFAQALQFQAYLAITIAGIHALSYFKTELSESKAKADILEELAYKDSLTGLNNRRRIYSALQDNLVVAERYQRPLSIILLDIDHFKQINDQYGHDVGDLVLQSFAELITPLLRGGDIWGRWGGEEFLIVCPETPIENAVTLAKRLCKFIQSHSFPKVSKLSASFGVSNYEQSLNIEDLLKQADELLYQAKRSGRNQVKYTQQETSLS